jgi:biopolymer transport protein ExbD
MNKMSVNAIYSIDYNELIRENDSGVKYGQFINVIDWLLENGIARKFINQLASL